jgi:hypothetical protein
MRRWKVGRARENISRSRADPQKPAAGKVSMTATMTIREWDADIFHQRVLEMTAQGYAAIRESYQITPEMNPETGEIIHLHQIDLEKQQAPPGIS